MPEIKRPGVLLGQVRRALKKAGCGRKQYYAEAKLVATTKYWWNAFKITTPEGTKTISGGYFYVYTYAYPDYYTQSVSITEVKYIGRDVGFYDSGIEEKLGGLEETLGG